MEDYDVVIVGGGPAGATLALLLDKDLRILLIDNKNYENITSYATAGKCCGGLLAPDAQQVFASLGLGIPGEVLESPQLFTVRTIDFDNRLERYYQRHYLNVNRFALDGWLLALAGESVELSLNSRFVSMEKTSDQRYHVSINVNGNREIVSTTLVIGADGANSMLRRYLLGNKDNVNKYFSIQEYYQVDRYYPYFVSVFDKTVTDFYSWIIPKHDYLILGSALVNHEQPFDKIALLKEHLAEYGFSFKDTKPFAHNGTFVLRPKCSDIYTGKDGVYLIGEAAGFISPSSAEGMSYALRSAIALAKEINNNNAHIASGYRHNCRSLKRNIFLKNRKSPFMYNRMLRKLVLKSGVLSLKLQHQGVMPAGKYTGDDGK